MSGTQNAVGLRFLFSSLSAMILLGGCSSQPALTQEELRLKSLYGREIAEDREYLVQPAGFAARPVQEPFIATFMRRVGDDGILFFPDGHMDRDPKFYVGKLSTFVLGTDMYGAQEHALLNLKALLEHGHLSHEIRQLFDSSYVWGGCSVLQFRWEIVDGSTAPLTQFQADQGATHDAEMIGAIVTTQRATYLVSLTENKMSTLQYKAAVCDADRISARDASGMMAKRFGAFLRGVRFDVE